MDHTVNLGMCGKDLIEAFFIGDVDLVEVWSRSTEQLYAIEGNFGRIVETVNDHDLIAMLEEGQRGERSDVTGASVELDISIAMV